MNELLNFEQYVRANLSDRVAARALIDFREQLLSVPHRVAVRAVAAIRRNEKNTREMAEAAALLAAEHQHGRDLGVAILWWAGIVYSDSVQILVVSGSRPPQLKETYRSNPGAFWHERTVLVGARFVIREAVEVAADMSYFEKLLTKRNDFIEA